MQYKKCQWRKQGDAQWSPDYVSLDDDNGKELVLLPANVTMRKTCWTCGVSLCNRMSVLVGPVPRRMSTDLFYCLEHSPTPVEVSSDEIAP